MNSSMSSAVRPITVRLMRVAPRSTAGRTETIITSGGSVASRSLKNAVHENVRWSINALASRAAAATPISSF